MCCTTCQTLPQYTKIHSKASLDHFQQLASTQIDSGNMIHSFSPTNSGDFSESQYKCNHCGTTFVLWLDAFMIKSGGEWRVIA